MLATIYIIYYDNGKKTPVNIMGHWILDKHNDNVYFFTRKPIATG